MAERRSFRLIAAACAGGVVAMVGAAYASVPLYRAFCQATGFNGTVRRAEAGPSAQALARTVTVRFDTNVRGLPWDFQPDVATQEVRIGAPGQAFFRVTNHGSVPLTGRAAYNVAPESAGAYFIKTQCFCFSEQTIPAGKTVEFPVIYYLDPKFAADDSTRAFQEVVLSYTFFPVPHPAQAAPARKG